LLKQSKINKMKRVIFLLLFLQSFLFSCDICVLSTPKTEVIVSVISNKTHIQKINFVWIVSKEFTSNLNQIYDQNTNKTLDKEEVENIYNAFISYVRPKDYLTKIFYYEHKENKELEKNILLDDDVYIKNKRLHLSYSIEFKKEIKNNYKLDIEVFDENQYFDLQINEYYSSFDPLSTQKDIKSNNPFTTENIDPVYTKKESDLSGILFTISTTELSKTLVKNKTINIKENKENKKELTYLQNYSLKIKEYLQDIKEGEDNLALVFLLFVSFIYGMIHAIGPGHGKSLAFSYFLVNKTSVSKALFISLCTAFIHILGAFILVLISVFILDSFLNSFVNDSITLLTKISAVLIILLALFILYNKIYKKACFCTSCQTPKEVQNKDFNKMTWSNVKTEEKKRKNKQDLYFVLTAGLIPCPGTVILFIYAFVLKTYFAVILASIFISLGMGLVIFASAFMGLGFKQLSHKSHKISSALEYAAILVMLILGLVLYFSF